MYSKLPNLVIAFHGCDYSTFDNVVRNSAALRSSNNDYDWLGRGIYFWEQNFERAFSWAEEQVARGSFKKPAVIGAVIDLGYCLNLTDSKYIELLANEYYLMKSEFEILSLVMPKNEGAAQDKPLRRLDRAVIEHLHARIASLKESDPPAALEQFDSARGLFSEGASIYEGAGFRGKTHVQICVRNPNCIKGYFEPRKPVKSWRVP